MSTNIALRWVHWKINQSTGRFYYDKIHRTASESSVIQPRLQQYGWELLSVWRRLQQRNLLGSIPGALDTNAGRSDKVRMLADLYACIPASFIHLGVILNIRLCSRKPSGHLSGVITQGMLSRDTAHQVSMQPHCFTQITVPYFHCLRRSISLLSAVILCFDF